MHLTTFPQYDEALIDDALATHVSMAKRVVELGRSARAEAKVRTRQPLSRALVGSAAIADLDDELLAEIAEELNVGSVEPLSSAGCGPGRVLGEGQLPRARQAVRQADAGGREARSPRPTPPNWPPRSRRPVLRPWWSTARPVEVSAAEVLLSERPREGWSVVNEQGETVALDLEVTPELKQAGLAREVVRTLQEARKNAGLEVSDRITVWLATTDAELADALGKHADEIASEVLATELTQSAPSATDQPGDRLGRGRSASPTG